jgi:hypothetical protein
MSGHYPTPWKRDRGWLTDAFGHEVLRSDAMRTVDVDFVLRACNSYDDLVVALRAAHYELLTLNPRLSGQYRKSVEQVLALASAALAKAQAGVP